MKKKYVKRMVSIGLVAIMCAGSLGGCGSQEISSAKGEGLKTEDGKTIVRIVRPTQNLGQADDEEVQKVCDAINGYIGDKINVQIELKEIPSGEYTDKVNLALANNEIDLFWTASWEGAISCDSLYKGNGAYDLTNIVKDTPLWQTMPEAVWEASSYNGRNYFVPVYKEVAEGYDLMFRKDLADQFDWDLSNVKELEDIEPMLQDCLEAGVEAPLLTQATAFAYKFMMDEYAWPLGNNYIGIDRDTNEVVSVFETPEYRDYVKMMCEWGEKGYIREGDATNSNPSNALQSQYWGISWWTDVPNNSSANTRYGQDVEMVHMTGNWIDSNTTLGSCYAVSSTASEEAAKASIEFLGLLYSDKALADIYTYGIEGTDYNFDEEGKVAKKGELYNHSAWESCNVMNVSLEAGEPDNKTDLYEEFNRNAKTSISAGFRFDSTPVEAQLASVESVAKKYGMVLENGGFAPEEVDEILKKYKEEMDEAGYQELLTEVTNQYEEWKSSK